VAKFFPVMRSIWALRERPKINKTNSPKLNLIHRTGNINAFYLKSALEF